MSTSADRCCLQSCQAKPRDDASPSEEHVRLLHTEVVLRRDRPPEWRRHPYRRPSRPCPAPKAAVGAVAAQVDPKGLLVCVCGKAVAEPLGIVVRSVGGRECSAANAGIIGMASPWASHLQEYTHHTACTPRLSIDGHSSLQKLSSPSRTETRPRRSGAGRARGARCACTSSARRRAIAPDYCAYSSTHTHAIAPSSSASASSAPSSGSGSFHIPFSLMSSTSASHASSLGMERCTTSLPTYRSTLPGAPPT